MNQKVAFLLLALWGCNGAFDSDSSGTLTVDQKSYVAVSNGAPANEYRIYSFTIIARFTNKSHETIQFSPALGLVPQFKIFNENGTEAPFITPSTVPSIALPVSFPLIQVAPGQTRTDQLAIYGPQSFDAGGQFDYHKLAGKFRLSYTGSAGTYYSGSFAVTLSDGGN